MRRHLAILSYYQGMDATPGRNQMVVSASLLEATDELH
jgi:hypothetical protein